MSHIGFTGTRHGMTQPQEDMFACLLLTSGPPVEALHHGDCLGADADAHHLAAVYGARSIIHPPTDDRLRAHCAREHVGPHEPEVRDEKPYLERNRDIVDESDRLIATPAESEEQPKGGTWYTVRYARSQGKPVTIIWPDGSIG